MAERSEPGSRGHLLVIEDEPNVRTALAMTLESEGYRVTTESNGPDALAQLAVERPDAIITDYMMPYWDGFTTIREIRAYAEYARIPIIMTSAMLPPDVDPRDAADVFLQKPVDVPRLVEVVELLRGTAGQGSFPEPR